MSRYQQDPGWKTLELLRQTGQSLGGNLQGIADQRRQARLDQQQSELLDLKKQEMIGKKQAAASKAGAIKTGAYNAWTDIETNPIKGAMYQKVRPDVEALRRADEAGDDVAVAEIGSRIMETTSDFFSKGVMENLKADYKTVANMKMKATDPKEKKSLAKQEEMILNQMKTITQRTTKPSMPTPVNAALARLQNGLPPKVGDRELVERYFKGTAGSESFMNVLSNLAITGNIDQATAQGFLAPKRKREQQIDAFVEAAYSGREPEIRNTPQAPPSIARPGEEEEQFDPSNPNSIIDAILNE